MRDRRVNWDAILNVAAVAVASTLFATGCGGTQNEVRSTSSKVRASSKGVVTLDSTPSYRAPGTVTITVADSDLNLSPASRDGASVTIASTTSVVPMTVNLTETAADSGIFTGSVPIVLVAQDGALTVSNGDIITVTYQDANDGTGSAAVATATATVDDTSPDLHMTAASGPASATAGDTINFTGTVANDSIGGSAYNWFAVSYFLKNRVDGSTTRVADFWPVYGLAAGQSQPVDVGGVIPTWLPGGDYDLLAVADSWGYVAESNESNNTFDPPPTIHINGLPLADLTMAAASGPSSAAAGDTVTFTGTVTNASGDQPTYNWFAVSYFLKNRVDGSTTRVADFWPVYGLAAGQSQPVDVGGVIPTWLPGGDNNLLAVADSWGYVAESNESNNTFDPPPTIHINGLPLADLTMAAASGPSSAAAGDTVTFTGTVTNASGDQPTYN